uniref:(California timema) hypothetical protein n=1 Tax=Timema californicum TaxID=61474 RepID=A0A7R9P8B1_TIMCA|nr:unnamed protein product [Timema californicum]
MTEIRTSISPSSAVELNTTSALANYASKASFILFVLSCRPLCCLSLCLLPNHPARVKSATVFIRMILYESILFIRFCPSLFDIGCNSGGRSVGIARFRTHAMESLTIAHSMRQLGLLVGAPLDQNLQPETNHSGALWRCPVSTRTDDCDQVVTDGKRSEFGLGEGEGATHVGLSGVLKHWVPDYQSPTVLF